ncbi:MAG: HDOD domain-containing protein [Myxococcota bacterium]
MGSYELPHFPGPTLEALSALRDESSSLERIAETLSVDPSLSVRILSLVNSAGFGLRTAVDDLPHAVHLVGRSPLESLLISVSVRQVLPRKATGVEPRAFWKSASCRASAARRLAELLCPSESHRSFTAGLLQEMAVPLLAERRGGDYAAVLDCWRDGGPELHDLERESFGWNHAEVGLLMCQVWELPERLAVAIGGHHDAPSADPDVPDPVLLSAFLRESDFQPGVDALIDAVHQRHGVDRERVIEIVDASFEDAEGLSDLLG